MFNRLHIRWTLTPWLLRWGLLLLFLVVAFYTIENIRGGWALKCYREEWTARGEWFDLTDAPYDESISDEENFLAQWEVVEILDRSDSIYSNYFNDGPFDIRGRHHYYRGYRFRELLKCQSHPLHIYHKESPLSRPVAASQILFETRGATEMIEALIASTSKSSVYQYEFIIDQTAGANINHVYWFARIQSLRALANIELNDAAASARQVASLFNVAKFTIKGPSYADQNFIDSSMKLSAQPVWEGLRKQLWNQEQLAEIADSLDFRVARHFSRSAFCAKRNIAAEGFQGGDSFHERIQMLINACKQNDYFGFTSFDVTEMGCRDLFEYILFCLAPDGWVDLWTIKYSEILRGRLSPGPLEERPLRELIFSTDIHDYAYEGVDRPSSKGINFHSLIRAAVAAERYRLKYGVYPQELFNLYPEFLDSIPHDVFSGDALKYIAPMTDSGRPVIYSVGTDGVDNGGQPFRITRGRKAWSYDDTVWRYKLPDGFVAEDGWGG